MTRDIGFAITIRKGDIVCDVYAPTEKEAKAYAALWEAAPNLLAAATKAADIIACIPPEYSDQIAVPRACTLADLRRAIAKAEVPSQQDART